MKLYLDTSTPETILKLDDQVYTWHSGNDLAETLLEHIHQKLQENHKTWHDLTEIEYMSGPGSFTGLRIGAAIVNSLSQELNIPLKDHKGKKYQVIVPNYGKPAHITPPKK